MGTSQSQSIVGDKIYLNGKLVYTRLPENRGKSFSSINNELIEHDGTRILLEPETFNPICASLFFALVVVVFYYMCLVFACLNAPGYC